MGHYQQLHDQKVTSPEPPRVLAYTLIRSRRRTLSVEVHSDGSILVRVPLRASMAAVEGFLRSRIDWILSRRRQAAEARAVIPLLSERQFHHRGNVMEWVADPSVRRPVLRSRTVGAPTMLVLPEREGESQSTHWQRVSVWQRRESEQVFHDMITACLPLFGVHALRFQGLRIRRMRRRWGACSATGYITLNEHLVRAPDVCIRAVVVHELVHLVHLHHGAAFHAMMADMLPDHAEADRLLDRWSAVIHVPRGITDHSQQDHANHCVLILD
jgi:predicted metal-dependent hydrolase